MKLVKIGDVDFYINIDHIVTLYRKEEEYYAELIDRDQPIQLSISAYNYILKNG